MAEKNTIARPYAQAAFNIAQADGDLKGWSDMLKLLSLVASDDLMQSVIGNSCIETEKVSETMIGACGETLNDKGKNFVRVMAENRRLNVLPEVAVLFEASRAEAEKTVEAEVASAFPLTDAQKNQIVEALKKRLGRDVSLKTRVDESIIGGAVVRAGDLVIDGSVTGQLEKLAANLMR